MQDQALLNIIWRGKFLILIAVVAAGAGAYLLASRADKVYEASATLQVHLTATPDVDAGDPLRTQQASQVLATTYASLLADESMLQQIAPAISGRRITLSDLKRKVRARAIEETALIELTVTDSSPNGARRLAAEVASGFIDLLEASLSERVEQQQRLLEDRLTGAIRRLRQQSLEPGAPDVKEQLESLRRARAELGTQLAALIARGAQQGGAVALVGAPTASSTPVSPRPLLHLFAGTLLGLLLGLALAALRVRVDRGLRSSDEAEQLLDLPVLASIPLRRRYKRGDPMVSQAFDVLCAKVAVLAANHDMKMVTVTSYRPGEGKTATAEGLAFAAPRRGLRVLVIDADLRTRGLSSRLGHAASPGLADLVLNDVPPAKVGIELAPGLTFIAAGRANNHAPSVLASRRMQELAAYFRREFDLIVVDSPPVAQLADAAIIASASDCVVLVARVGTTQQSDLRSVSADLSHTDVPIVGLVVLEPVPVNHAYAQVPS